MIFKNIATVRAGRTFAKGVHESESGTLSVIQLSDITDDTVSQVNWPRVVKVVPEAKYAINYLRPNDLLIIARGPIKKVILLNDCTPDCAVPTQHFLFASLNNVEEVLPEFVEYYLSSAPIQQWLNNQSSGSKQSTLTKTVLENMPFPDIPMERQREIITCVNSVNEEIAIHEQLISGRKIQLDNIVSRLFNK